MTIGGNGISQEHDGAPAAPTSPTTPVQVDEAKLRDTPVMIDFHDIDSKVESELKTEEEFPNLDLKSFKLVMALPTWSPTIFNNK
jgi:hypothetical protein